MVSDLVSKLLRFSSRKRPGGSGNPLQLGFRTWLLDAGRSAVIINLQKTCKDTQAALVIHAKCDAVMGSLASQLGLSIPSYRREDRCRPGAGFVRSA